MSKLCSCCGGTGLEPESEPEPEGYAGTVGSMGTWAPDPKGRAANIYQDLLAGTWGRPFVPGDLTDTEGYDDDN